MLVFFISFSFDLFQYGDAGGYTVLGMAVSQGEGFVDIASPVKPYSLWWPPGFPIFIASFCKLFGPQLKTLKIVIYCLLYISLLLYSIVIYRRRDSFADAAAVLTALAFSSGIHLLSSYLYSETFYIAVSLFFFYLWYRWEPRLTLTRIMVLSAVAVYTAAVRNIGLTLPAAMTLHLFFRPLARGERTGWRQAALPCVFIIAYICAITLVPQMKVLSFSQYFKEPVRATTSQTAEQKVSSTSHIKNHYSDKLTRSLRGYVLTLVPQSLIRSTYDSCRMNNFKAIAMFLVTAVVLWGWVVTWPRFALMNLYALLFMGVLFSYGPLYVRLVVPIIPSLMLYFYAGLRRIVFAAIRNRRIAVAVLALLWIYVIADNAHRALTDPRRTMPSAFGDERYQSCIEWVVSNAKPDEVVVCQTHWYLFLRRGPYCIIYDAFDSPESFISYLAVRRADYLVISPFYMRPTYTYMDTVRKAVTLYPDRFEKVFGEPGDSSYVLKFIKTPGIPGSESGKSFTEPHSFMEHGSPRDSISRFREIILAAAENSF